MQEDEGVQQREAEIVEGREHRAHPGKKTVRPRQPKWWSDVLSGRVRKDWAAMAQAETFEDWARRSMLEPAVPGAEGFRKRG